MKYYLKLSDENVIVDAITYPFEGFVEADIPEYPLPCGINSGYYFWDGFQYTIDEIRKAAFDEGMKNIRKSQNQDIINEEVQKAIDNYTLELLEGGLL